MSDPQGVPVETGTRSSSLVQCGCGALLDLDVKLTSATPGARLSAVVIATLPCACGKVGRALVKIEEEMAA